MPIQEEGITKPDSDLLLSENAPLRREITSILTHIPLYTQRPGYVETKKSLDISQLAFRLIERGDMTIVVVGTPDIVTAAQEVPVPEYVHKSGYGSRYEYFWETNVPGYEDMLEGFVGDDAFTELSLDEAGEFGSYWMPDMLPIGKDGTYKFYSERGSLDYIVYFMGAGDNKGHGGLLVYGE